MNCYGWATCSCPAFEKYGSACKHLWAFQFIISHMQTPYSFIFPDTEVQARDIYSTLFIPVTSTNPSSTKLPLQMVDHSSLPPPLPNELGQGSSEIFDSFGEEDNDMSEKEIETNEELIGNLAVSGTPSTLY
ncbi:hypothetical protein M422DRAFT_239207 [Sphaerobolus stellatus SS14]|nr:hypothetical protein M422DRAFT_239207 [Sphaerobolus stellatus SS14]